MRLINKLSNKNKKRKPHFFMRLLCLFGLSVNLLYSIPHFAAVFNKNLCFSEKNSNQNPILKPVFKKVFVVLQIQ